MIGGSRPDGVLHRWHSEKRSGKDQAGQRYEDHSMAVADSSGLPLSVCAASASLHESKLVEQTIEARFIEEKPERLIGDKAYDSDALDEELKEVGIEMIAPHRGNRKSSPTQDGRALRR